MRNDGPGALIAVALLVFFAGAMWLKGLLGVDFQVASELLWNVVVAAVILGIAWWAAKAADAPFPLEVMLPLLWWMSWPLLIAKGNSTPSLLAYQAAEPELRWFARQGFRWAALLFFVGGGGFLYVKRSGRFR